jgi:nitrate reductase gamma subunit
MMNLLDFARGPALQVALGIFVFGVTWRVVSLLLMPRLKEKSRPRPGAKPVYIAGTREIIRRLWPDHEFARRTLFNLINGYIFHFGLAIIVFATAPHILFFEDLFGLSWPNLPNNVIFAVGVITLVSLIAALAKRLSNPVQKLISTSDDYVSWTLTFLPVLTGLIASSHLGARYETLLAIHVLSVEAFLIWLPFGKLMHWLLVFVTRGQTGAHLNHRGAQL